MNSSDYLNREATWPKGELCLLWCEDGNCKYSQLQQASSKFGLKCVTSLHSLSLSVSYTACDYYCLCHLFPIYFCLTSMDWSSFFSLVMLLHIMKVGCRNVEIPPPPFLLHSRKQSLHSTVQSWKNTRASHFFCFFCIRYVKRVLWTKEMVDSLYSKCIGRLDNKMTSYGLNYSVF